eukprot:m.136273 g.136273  ORF g.136273 m.136273 type:complete len:646 (+) comp16580_c0_seq1:361-2298(+)
MAAPDDGKNKYPPEIADHYIIKETIGSGGFAKVKIARHKMTSEKVAIKIMDKAHLKKTDDLKRVPLEINALKVLRHPNISRLYQVHETEDKFFLVLEYAPGGELFDYIVTRDRLKEEEARMFFRQIVAAVAFCHSKGIAHRDLKPENLLLDSSKNIKLIDFGLIAHPVDLASVKLKTCCGSAAYAAPELIRGEPYLGPPADIWSLGILLYALLCGFLPFDDENTQRLYRLIQRGQYEIPAWLSQDSIRLIGQLLQHNPENRLSMAELLKHPWLVKGLSTGAIEWNFPDEAEPEEFIVQELAKYYALDAHVMASLIKERKYDQVTASYELLRQRRQRGFNIRLPAARSHLPIARTMALMGSRRMGGNISVADDDEHSEISLNGLLKDNFGGSAYSLNSSADNLTGQGRATDVDALGDSMARSGSLGASSLEPRLTEKQRWSSQGMDPSTGLDRIEPGEQRIVRTSSTPGLATPKKEPAPRAPGTAGAQAQAPRGASAAAAAGATASQSMTPDDRERDQDHLALGHPGSLTSLRSIARSMMSLFGGRHEPRKVKGAFNVATTSRKEPKEVLDEITRMCQEEGLEFKVKGFLVKTKVFDTTGKPTVCINFEVCRVQGLDLTGIRLTRVKGDTWLYKRTCERLLGLLRL